MNRKNAKTSTKARSVGGNEAHEAGESAPSAGEQTSAESAGILVRASQWLEARKAIMQAAGFVSGLLLLGVTAWYVSLTADALRLNQAQFSAVNTPTWVFDIDRSQDRIRIVSSDPAFVVQAAKVICPDTDLNDGVMDAIEPPSFDWPGAPLLEAKLRTRVAAMLTKACRDLPASDDSGVPVMLTPVGSWYYPVAIVVDYAHLGRHFQSTSVFSVQCGYSGPTTLVTKPPSSSEIDLQFRGLQLIETLESQDESEIARTLRDYNGRLSAYQEKPSFLTVAEPPD